MTKCCYCNQDFADKLLRPYGPDGQPTCYRCAHATPERKAITNKYCRDEARGIVEVARKISDALGLKVSNVAIVDVDCPCPECNPPQDLN